ncbi:MAG: gephyrin-like molybdotransferase Glp [Candidatus Bathyarchaeia archaeon]
MTRLKGFQKLTPVEEAKRIFFNKLQTGKLKTIKVPLEQALNRVLAEDIRACEDLPRFDRSAVDGYAIKAEETVGVTQFKPKTFRITSKENIENGEVKQVWTGSPIPKGADAVVMLENTKKTNSELEVWVSVTPGENIAKRGEDIRKGEIAIKAGTRLKPQHLGLIAALGIVNAKVFEKPKVAILATGNELVEIGTKPQEGQIFEVNRLILSALCRELEVEPVDLGIARDDTNEITEKMKLGLKVADMVITTGGTSVGLSDIVPDAINKLGKLGIIVHGMAMRPAMPTALAIVNEKPIIILSGNPVAAMIGFEVFAKPVINVLMGLEREESRPVIKAQMTKRVTTALGRKTFVRVHVFKSDEEYFAEPISSMGSGVISTMTKANGYVVVPENVEGLDEGETVSVHLFDTVEERACLEGF